MMNPKHENITAVLIKLAEQNPELKKLLEKSVKKAREANPDINTNPVTDLQSYYSFIDRCARALPWEISPSGAHRSVYDRIDQGMGCLYFVCDQPLEELEGKGYFHNSLIYHEPFAGWFAAFLSISGIHLDMKGTWTDEYLGRIREDPRFHLTDGTYEDAGRWTTFNEFFARRLRTASVRPVAGQNDGTVVVSPADAVPQGVWKLDKNGMVAQNTGQSRGLPVKTGTLSSVPALLRGSRYADSFGNGILTHTFLDVSDYHRYHFPVSGIVREVLRIPQDTAPGGIIVWDAGEKRYKLQGMDVFGWQSLETRGAVIIETESGGLVAVVPVGMCQVASVNFEKEVVKGHRAVKGDPLGYFLFGGSDIIMIFSENLSFRYTAETGVHLNMGRQYGRFCHTAAAADYSPEEYISSSESVS